MREVLEHVVARDASAPVHIHIAEQQAEVDDCLAWSGARPIEWLFAHTTVTPQWCLVHATHADESELRLMAAARVVAGLCPTTEANLGDGLFEAETFLAAGGAIGIGSDSHASVDVAEELRWLEYGRRLALERRAVLGGEGEPSVGGRRIAPHSPAAGRPSAAPSDASSLGPARISSCSTPTIRTLRASRATRCSTGSSLPARARRSVTSWQADAGSCAREGTPTKRR